MKRTFLSRRNALFTSASFSAGAIALLFAMLILGFRLLFPNAFWLALSPIFRASDAVGAGTHNFFAGFENAAALLQKNEELSRENAALANENHALAEKAGALGALAPGIWAGVVARPPESPYDTLIVSAGAKADVSLSMEAFGPGGVPVGVVTEVLPDFSRIVLFSSPSMSFDAWIGPRHIPLVIKGLGGGAFGASISRLAGVAQGDQVYVAAGGSASIGSVVRIDSDPSSPSTVLQIQGAVNPFSLTWLSLKGTGSAFIDALSWENAQSL